MWHWWEPAPLWGQWAAPHQPVSGGVPNILRGADVDRTGQLHMAECSFTVMLLTCNITEAWWAAILWFELILMSQNGLHGCCVISAEYCSCIMKYGCCSSHFFFLKKQFLEMFLELLLWRNMSRYMHSFMLLGKLPHCGFSAQICG